MFEFLKSKSRKEKDAANKLAKLKLEEEKLKLEEEKKKLEEEKIDSLKKEYQEVREKFQNEIDSKNRNLIEGRKISLAKTNSICPKCGSKKLVDKVSRIKGEIDGKLDSSFSSTSSSSLFSHYNSSNYSSNGSLHGEIDTLSINKCADCNNEWKKEEMDYSSNYDFEEYIKPVIYSLREFYDANNVSFDSNDISEKFDSKEEKMNHYLDRANTSIWLDESKKFWGGVSISVFNEILKKELFCTDYNRKYYDEYNYKDRMDILINKIGMK